MVSSKMAFRSGASKIMARSFSTSMATLRGTGDKRIPVQLLKDFEGVGYKGEVISVLPGFMRNKLHRNSGAAYVLKNKPLRIPEVKREDILAEIAARDAVKQKELNKLQEERSAQESKFLNRRMTSEEDMKAALDNLGLNINLFKPANNLESEPEESISESSLYYVETTVRSLPAVIVLHKPAKSTGFLGPRDQVTVAALSKHLTNITGVEIDSSLITFPIPSNPKESASAIDFVGDSDFVFKFPNGKTYNHQLRIIPTNSDGPLNEFLTLKRPASTPYPGADGESSNAETASVPAPEQKDSKTTAKPQNPPQKQEEAPFKKEFEWENDFINEISKR